MTATLRGFTAIVLAMMVSGCVATINSAPRPIAGCSIGTEARCNRLQVVQACTETVNRYVFVRDRLLYDEYAALFTETAVFQIEGREAAVEIGNKLTGNPWIFAEYHDQFSMIDGQCLGAVNVHC